MLSLLQNGLQALPHFEELTVETGSGRPLLFHHQTRVVGSNMSRAFAALHDQAARHALASLSIAYRIVEDHIWRFRREGGE